MKSDRHVIGRLPKETGLSKSDLPVKTVRRPSRRLVWKWPSRLLASDRPVESDRLVVFLEKNRPTRKWPSRHLA